MSVGSWVGEIRIISRGGLGRLEKNALTRVPVFVLFFSHLLLFYGWTWTRKRRDQICYPVVPLGYVNNPEHVFCKADWLRYRRKETHLLIMVERIVRADVHSHESTTRCKHGDYRDPNFAKLSKHRRMPSLRRNAFCWHRLVAHRARLKSEGVWSTKIWSQNESEYTTFADYVAVN